MNFNFLAIQVITLLLINNYSEFGASAKLIKNKKKIMTVILSQNEEPFLPYFLSFFQRLTFPKENLSLFIRSGNNRDKTKDILTAWLAENIHKYHSINVQLDDKEWNYDVHAEEALEEARNKKFEYIWFLNQKTFITNEDVLQNILKEKLLVAAPLVNNMKSFYSNFWGAMSDDYDYVRSNDYINIVQREKRGCYQVALLDSLFLIDLRNEKSKYLTFDNKVLGNYTGPSEARIVFSESAKRNGIYLHICNIDEYGIVKSPFHNLSTLQDIKNHLHRKKIPHQISEELLPFMSFPKPNNFGFDQIYVINLARQTKRKMIMQERLREIGLNATFYEAVNGETLNERYLLSLGFRPNKNFENLKCITKGMIGNSLSHYSIWKKAILSNYSKIMILEDDASFDEKFSEHLENMLQELEDTKLQWDFIYLGRNKIRSADDILFNNTKHLIFMDYYNYRAFGYMINQSGAKKLYKQEFISNLVPTGDYFFFRYVEPSKREIYKNVVEFDQDLKAYAIHPSIVHHAYFLKNGEMESDTIDSLHFSEAFDQFSVEKLQSFHGSVKNEL